MAGNRASSSLALGTPFTRGGLTDLPDAVASKDARVAKLVNVAVSEAVGVTSL